MASALKKPGTGQVQAFEVLRACRHRLSVESGSHFIDNDEIKDSGGIFQVIDRLRNGDLPRTSTPQDSFLALSSNRLVLQDGIHPFDRTDRAWLLLAMKGELTGAARCKAAVKISCCHRWGPSDINCPAAACSPSFFVIDQEQDTLYESACFSQAINAK